MPGPHGTWQVVVPNGQEVRKRLVRERGADIVWMATAGYSTCWLCQAVALLLLQFRSWSFTLTGVLLAAGSWLQNGGDAVQTMTEYIWRLDNMMQGAASMCLLLCLLLVFRCQPMSDCTTLRFLRLSPVAWFMICDLPRCTIRGCSSQCANATWLLCCAATPFPQRPSTARTPRQAVEALARNARHLESLLRGPVGGAVEVGLTELFGRPAEQASPSPVASFSAQRWTILLSLSWPITCSGTFERFHLHRT